MAGTDRSADLSGVARVAAAATPAGARLAGDPAGWLPGPTRRRGPDRWAARVHAGPVARDVTCEVGGAWRHGEEVWRRLRWRPDEAESALPPARALPGFVGEVGLVVDEGGPAVVVRGRAEPPGGVVGAAVDAAVLHRVGQATVARFAREVADRLSRSGPARPVEPSAAPGRATPPAPRG